MAKVIITQIKSGINRPKRQKATLVALGIKKMHQVVEHEATPQILGMIVKVKHLVEVKEVSASKEVKEEKKEVKEVTVVKKVKEVKSTKEVKEVKLAKKVKEAKEVK